MEFRIIENTFSIKIENKIYFIYESYIENGTGYTFSIYKSSKMCQLRNDYYTIDRYNKFVIIGKKNNYLLIKHYRKNKLKFRTIKYDKTILKCVSDKKSHDIYLNNERLVSYYGSNKLFEKDMKICENIIRKQKLIKINNE